MIGEGRDPPPLDELAYLCSALSAEERDGLLQGLVTAAPLGGAAMIAVLEAWPLDRAVWETIEGLGAALDGP